VVLSIFEIHSFTPSRVSPVTSISDFLFFGVIKNNHHHRLQSSRNWLDLSSNSTSILTNWENAWFIIELNSEPPIWNVSNEDKCEWTERMNEWSQSSTEDKCEWWNEWIDWSTNVNNRIYRCRRSIALVDHFLVFLLFLSNVLLEIFLQGVDPGISREVLSGQVLDNLQKGLGISFHGARCMWTFVQ